MKIIMLLVSISVTSCALVHKRSQEPVASASPAAVAANAGPHETAAMQESAGAHKTEAAPAHPDAGNSVEPGTSLRWLTNGNVRYVKKHLRKDGQSRADIVRLSTGQHPHAIVLSCSDSRVPPELVFDQKLGEIFTVRTAGQALDHNVIGSIEYAVEHLGTRMIVVMGHTSCGAVKAAHGTLAGSSAGTPSLDELVKDIHPRIAMFKGQPPTEGLEKESWANAQGVAQDLLARSNLLAEKRAHDEIWVVPALYDLKTGHVTFHEALRPEVRTPASPH